MADNFKKLDAKECEKTNGGAFESNATNARIFQAMNARLKKYNLWTR